MRRPTLRPISVFRTLVAMGFILGLLSIHAAPMESEEQGRNAAVEADVAQHTLLYVSDYLSFVGKDDQGHVAFALDTNRGRDGDTWQAEHFVVLHEEGRGWVELAGNGAYENPPKQLRSIPDSPFFHFRGKPATGLRVTSEPNTLTLRIDPIPRRLSRTAHTGRYWMGSAPALLQWNERVLKGRVIYEYLFMPDFNRLSRIYFGLWKEFQGLYASAEGSGDLYLHSQQSDMMKDLVGRQDGFVVLDGQGDGLDTAEVTVLSRAPAMGFYRWPTQWRVRWLGRHGVGSAELTLSDKKVIANWVIGGFAMGIIRGEIRYAGRSRQVYGLAELLM